MTIDPSTPLGSSLQALKTQHQTSVESLARVLNLKVGETVTGSVIQATQTTPATRQTLLQTYLEQQRPAQTQSSGNTGQAATDEIALLKSAKLQLVKLQVGPQQLLTYTDQPVKAQQQVQLLLKTANTLTLLQTTTPSGQSEAKASPPALNMAPPALKQALRSALPNQAPIHNLEQGRQLSDSLQTGLLLNQLTQKLGSYSAQTLIPKTVQDALKTVASHLRTPAQLSDPKTLKQTIQGSGMQLESKLKQLSQTTANPQTSSPANQRPPRNGPSNPLAALPSKDLKAALLVLLQRTQNQSSATTPSHSSNPQTGVQSNPNTLLSILKALLQGVPQLTQVKQEIPREALIQQLQQLVQQALNKIQYQQLQTLSRLTSGAQDSLLPTINHWQLEIPLRYGNEVYPMHLQIDEHRVHSREEKESTENQREEPRKQRKWVVRLSFELPDAGFFHAQLTIIDDAVNASLWAENPATHKKAQSQLDTLQKRLSKAGVEVKSLDCFPGKPNQQDNRLSYSLVDIKT